MSEAEIRPSSKIKELLDGIKIRMEQTKAAYDMACEEYAAALAILRPAKDKKPVKAPGKPRGPRKALGKGTEPPAPPAPAEAAGEPEQVKGGRWRNPGSVVTYATREEAMGAREA